jgi:hypothetical protein
MASTPTQFGSFCWFELATSDQEGAKKFYSSLFGWRPDDSPMGPGEMYTMFKLGGKDAAAAYTMKAEQKAMGVPPNWLVYVLVKSADEAAAKAKALGATVHVEPFDVMDAGRMSVIQDPTGATFCVWQRMKHTGVAAKGHGSAVWVDLNTTDQVRAGKFYSALFGWKMADGKGMKPAKPGDYFHIMNGSTMVGGIVPPGPHMAKMPSNWLTYFDVANANATIAKVKSHGGQVLMPPMTMGNVRTFAVLADPQGAAFAIVQSLGGHEEGAPRPEAAAKPKPKAKKAAPAKKSKATPKRKAKAGKAKPVKKAKAKKRKRRS